MADDLKTIALALQLLMAETVQLLVARLDREVKVLPRIATDLKDYADRLQVHQREGEGEGRSHQDQLKSELLPVVAHEVRTSLVALKGALYIILNEQPAAIESHRNLLACAYQNVERVMDLLKSYIF